MKGLLLSLIIFGLYVITTAIASHCIKPRRHSSFFLGFIIPAILSFSLSYYFTPANLVWLSPSWEAHYPWIDVTLGFVILLLNINSYFTWFFGFNGGFSTSLMLLLLRYKPQGATAHELIKHYYTSSGYDKVQGWRVPYLQAEGYLKIDPKTNFCSLTKKGTLIANLAKTAKKVLNLGTGG